MKLLAIGLVWLIQAAVAQNPAPKNQRVGVITRGGSYLGVGVLEVDSEKAKALGLPEERGVQVTSVDADSPASRAGVQVKDVILEFNGEHVEGTAQFVRMVMETPAGRSTKLGVFRNGAMQTLTVRMGARPDQMGPFGFTIPGELIPPSPPSPPSPFSRRQMDILMPDIPIGLMGWQSSTFGYVTEPVDGQMAEYFGVKQGVLVRSVRADSPAEKAGLKAGDVIVKADGVAVKTPREITNIHRGRMDGKLSLTIVRSHKEMTVELIALWGEKPDSLVM
jgi:serine protease Do